MNLFDVYPLYDIEPVRGRGCYVYDQKGVEYLDFYGGHAVISIGHSHPHYIQRITKQLQKLGFYSNSIINSLQKELADKLGKISGCEDYQLFLINSGAEANENAIKLASFQNGRKKVISFKKSFHGRTSAACNVTDDPKIKSEINKTFDVEFCPLNETGRLEELLESREYACVIIEGIQGIGGVYVPDATFLRELQTLCRKTETLFILDEIQSGYGRSGKFFAYQHADDIRPDLITVAKGMGNGFPIGGVLIQPGIKARHGMLGTTFGGNHLACAAALAVLEVMEEDDLVSHSAEVGEYLMAEMTQIPQVREVRGKGLMVGVEFDFPVADLRKQLVFKERVFTGSAADPNTLRLLPPLSIQANQVDQLTEKLRSVLRTLSDKTPGYRPVAKASSKS
ncbi:MAG TPA: aminotransferase class III-fold pyridoxal phosphate-dependent enzyme [Saprospiraceae bacterium]|nr:aminotransferase class III-fold pyridoxal phosphate-dependent enzyme [Saprospiraceae bacterium]HNT22148.1 aminotransferase class III-fold pyridoxal phosphate-dependent enzyme [Saprospiraceae bacterium]